jgi:outer membrane protein
MLRTLGMALLLVAPALAQTVILEHPRAIHSPLSIPSTPPPATHLPGGGLLTLDQAVSTSITHNPGLLSALKLVDSAVAQYKEAYAPFYPSLDLFASDVRTDAELVTSPSTSTVNGISAPAGTASTVTGGAGPNFSNTRYVQGYLSLNYVLLDFGRRHYNVQSFERTLEAARQSARTTMLNVMQLVRQQYYQTDTDQETLRVQQETVKNQRHHLNRAIGYYKAGLQARNEVTKAAADLANAQLLLVQARNTLQLDWVVLNQDMGLAQDTSYDLLVDPIHVVNLPHDPLVELAYQRRPEGLQLKALIDQDLDLMEINYANRLPVISGSANAGLRGAELPLPSFWTVGLTLQLNLFNGFLDRYAARSLRAQADALAEQYEQTRQSIYKDVSSAYLTLGNTLESITVSTTNLSSSVDNFRLANQRYDTGLGNNLEFEDAQVILSRSRIAEVTAGNSYRIALAQLLRAVGVDSLEQLEQCLHALPASRAGSGSRT